MARTINLAAVLSEYFTPDQALQLRLALTRHTEGCLRHCLQAGKVYLITASPTEAIRARLHPMQRTLDLFQGKFMAATQRNSRCLVESSRGILRHVVAQAYIGFLDGVLKADEFLP
jgi:hypothetical protein